MSRLAFFALLALVAALRIVELIVSRRRAAKRPEHLEPEPLLFPLMVLLHVGLIVAPAFEVVAYGREPQAALGVPAVAVLVLALALRVWTLKTLGAAWNVRVLVPADEQVVTSGPYAWIRHPNYLVVILEIAALPLLHSAWVSALGLSLLNAIVLARRIPTEERCLATLPSWREAMGSRARLIPGIL